MADIQYFKVVDALDGYPVEDNIVGASRTVRLKLHGFAQVVSEVTVNGLMASAFTVSGTRVLDVVLPPMPVFLTTALRDLSFLVLSSEWSGRARTSEVLFAMGRQSQRISGHQALLQKWLRFFLMTPGSDRADPAAGAGIAELAGSVVASDVQTIQARVAQKHSACKQQILTRQLQYSGRPIPQDELLRDANLRGVTVDQQNRIQIVNALVDGRGRMLQPSMLRI